MTTIDLFQKDTANGFLRRTLLALGLLCSLLFGNLAFAQAATPKATVETTVNNLLAILRKPDFSVEKDGATVSAEIKKAFDSLAMAQSVLSTAWRDASPEQRTEFQDLLLRTLEHTYLGRIDVYTDETVEFRNEEITDNRATVKTVILADAGEIPVNYKLRLRDNLWYVYDVEVENVSLVSTYRETYRSVVSSSGLDGLLKQMRARLAEPPPADPGLAPPV